MTDGDDQDNEAFVFDPSDDAVVAYPIAPQSLQIAAKRLSEAARVFGGGYSRPQIPKDEGGGWLADFPEILCGVLVELDLPDLTHHGDWPGD
jgi:hypothetical protein